MKAMSESDFDRLFAMGMLSLVPGVVGAVGVGFAIFKPKSQCGAWPRRLYPLGCRCVSRSAWTDNPRGIRHGAVPVGGGAGNVDSTQSKAGQGSSEEAVQATAGETGTVAEGP